MGQMLAQPADSWQLTGVCIGCLHRNLCAIHCVYRETGGVIDQACVHNTVRGCKQQAGNTGQGHKCVGNTVGTTPALRVSMDQNGADMFVACCDDAAGTPAMPDAQRNVLPASLTCQHGRCI
jgi:hypothetical protein